MKILTTVLENWKKSHPKHFTEKPILLNFKNLSRVFCIILTFTYCLLPFDVFIHNLVKREQISFEIPLNKDWKLFFLECSSKLTLKPNEKQISVHIGGSVAVTCIGPGLPGRRNTLLNWEFVNKSKIPTNMKTSSRDDIHTNKVICDVEKLDILGFKKENEGDYRCIQRENHSPHAIRSHADVRIVMKGKGSFSLLHFNCFSCKNSSNYSKARLFLFVYNI